MSLEDSNRNPPPPAFVNPTPGATGNSTSGEVPGPVQNPAFRGPPGPATPGSGYQPVEAQRHRSHEPPPIVTDPSQDRTPGSPGPAAGQPDPPVVSVGSPNPRRGRFNQTLALADYQRPPTSPVPAVPPLGTAGTPGGFQPAAVGDAVLTQAPGTELGRGGDPNATAAVAAVPPELQRYLDEQQRLVEARAAGRHVENVATPPGAVPAQQIYAAPPVQSPAGFPVQAAYAVPAQPPPAPAQSPFAAPFTSQSSYGGSPQPPAPAAPVQPAFVQPVFEQPRPASYESPSAPPFTPPPAAANARPVPTLDRPFVSSVPSRPPPGSPWPAAVGDSTFERDLASLPGPRAPGQRSPSTPSPAAPAAPKEPVIAVKWAALIAIATFVAGMMLGMTMYSML